MNKSCQAFIIPISPMENGHQKCAICGGQSASGPETPGFARCGACGHLSRTTAARTGGAQSGAPHAVRSGIATAFRLGYSLKRLMGVMGGLPTSARVLEVGYGSGFTLSALFERGFSELHGVDPSGGSPEIKNKKGETLEPDRLRRVRLEEADLPGEFFDLVFMIHVIEHLGDPGKAIRKIHDSLRPGGSLYIVTPDAGSASRGLFGRRWWFLSDPTHVNLFTEASLRRLLEDGGFRVEALRRPAFDSLTSEAVSALGQGLGGPTRNAAALALSACFLPVRMLMPSFRPSIEVVAKRAG